MRLKPALLAAISLTAASVAVAHAADATPVEPVAIEHAVQSADHAGDRASPTVIAQKAGLAAALAAGLAGLARLVGFRRLKRAAAATAVAAGKAASAGAAATVTVAKAVARAVASPFRYILLLASLAVAALAGVGLYDVEWAGGLVFGAALAMTVMLGARKALGVFQSSGHRLIEENAPIRMSRANFARPRAKARKLKIGPLRGRRARNLLGRCWPSAVNL